MYAALWICVVYATCATEWVFAVAAIRQWTVSNELPRSDTPAVHISRLLYVYHRFQWFTRHIVFNCALHTAHGVCKDQGEKRNGQLAHNNWTLLWPNRNSIFWSIKRCKSSKPKTKICARTVEAERQSQDTVVLRLDDISDYTENTSTQICSRVICMHCTRRYHCKREVLIEVSPISLRRPVSAALVPFVFFRYLFQICIQAWFAWPCKCCTNSELSKTNAAATPQNPSAQQELQLSSRPIFMRTVFDVQ